MGRGLVADADHRRQPDREDHRRAGRLGRHAPERDGRRGDRAVVLRPEAAAQPHRLRRGAVPVGALRAAGVGALRRGGRRVSRRRSGDRRDRRAHAARPDLARPLQVGGDPGHRRDRCACARDGRACVPRRVSVRGHGPVRRDGARCRVLRRRLGEVAVRRAGRGVSVRAARSRRAAGAGVRGLAGACAAVRVRDVDGVRAGRDPLLDGHAHRRGELRSERWLRDRRRDRRRSHPRELDAPDRVARLARSTTRGSS